MKGESGLLAKRKLSVFLLLSCITFTSCTGIERPNIKEVTTELNQLKASYKDIESEKKMYEVSIEELEKQMESFKQKYEVADEERKLYREDIGAILNVLKHNKPSGMSFPIFIGFDKIEADQEHIKLIRKYLAEWERNYLARDEIEKDIEPILFFLNVERRKNMNTQTDADTYYYSVRYYQSAVTAKQHSERGCIRGGFDGLIEWVVQIALKDGQWYVKEFGPES